MYMHTSHQCSTPYIRNGICHLVVRSSRVSRGGVLSCRHSTVYQCTNVANIVHTYIQICVHALTLTGVLLHLQWLHHFLYSCPRILTRGRTLYVLYVITAGSPLEWSCVCIACPQLEAVGSSIACDILWLCLNLPVPSTCVVPFPLLCTMSFPLPVYTHSQSGLTHSTVVSLSLDAPYMCTYIRNPLTSTLSCGVCVCVCVRVCVCVCVLCVCVCTLLLHSPLCPFHDNVDNLLFISSHDPKVFITIYGTLCVAKQPLYVTIGVYLVCSCVSLC